MQHINIFFYYLRKMSKYGKPINKLTTTDEVFDQTLGTLLGIYEDPKLRDKESIFTDDNLVAQ